MLNMMIAFANSAGPRWAAWIGAASLDAAALLALISLAWLVVRNRVAPQVGYCLFLLVPLKLLAPIAVTAPAVVAVWTPSAVAASWFADDPEVKEIESRQHVDVSIASSPAVAVEAIEPMLPPEPQAERPIATTVRPLDSSRRRDPAPVGLGDGHGRLACRRPAALDSVRRGAVTASESRSAA